MLKKKIILLFLLSSVLSLEPSNGECSVEKCQLCPESPDKCEKCQPEFFLDGKICNDCTINCKNCNDQSQKGCTQCIQNYAFNDDHLCVKADVENCLKLDDSKKEKCKECIPEYFLSDNTCLDCAINCKKCSGPLISECEICNQKYALDSENICQRTEIENCWKLEINGTKCAKCLKGYKLTDEKCVYSSASFYKLGLILVIAILL